MINTLCRLSPYQIRQVSDAYKKEFSKTLEKELHGETGGDFRRLLETLLKVGTGEMDAYCLYHAMKGAGTNEAEILDCLVGRSTADVTAIASAYKVFLT